MFTERHEAAWRPSAPRGRPASSPSGRTAPPSSGPMSGSPTCCHSRTGAARSAPRSPAHTGRSTPSATCPTWIEQRAAALAEGRARMGACVSCAVVADELGSSRIIHSDPTGPLACLAPRWPYEVHVHAIRHGARRLTDLIVGVTLPRGRAPRSSRAVNGLFGFELPYTMAVHEVSRGTSDWHLAVELSHFIARTDLTRCAPRSRRRPSSTSATDCPRRARPGSMPCR